MERAHPRGPVASALSLMSMITALALALVSASPTTAHALPQLQQDDPLTCEPADIAPGESTECTATGLEADSDFTWSVQFADGELANEMATADDTGTGTFTVTAPDSADAEGTYTVTVTGTDADGAPYEETFQGEVTSGDAEEGDGPVPTTPPTDEPTDEPGDDPSPESSDAPERQGQVFPAPVGAAATGAGGTADGGTPVALVVALTALAVIGGLVLAARHDGVLLRGR